jgi:hypothetical protein
MRAGKFTEVAKEMIDKLYGEEGLECQRDAYETSVSVKVSLSTASLLNELSSRFSESRYAFAGGILEDLALDLLLNLSVTDREKISIRSDKLTQEILVKKGITTSCLDSTWQDEVKDFLDREELEKTRNLKVDEL